MAPAQQILFFRIDGDHEAAVSRVVAGQIVPGDKFGKQVVILQVKAGDGSKFGGGQIINRPLKPVTAPVNSLLLLSE